MWQSLPGDYERGELVRHGTAFTTYEDHGTAVCAHLNQIARSWARKRTEAEIALDRETIERNREARKLEGHHT